MSLGSNHTDPSWRSVASSNLRRAASASTLSRGAFCLGCALDSGAFCFSLFGIFFSAGFPTGLSTSTFFSVLVRSTMAVLSAGCSEEAEASGTAASVGTPSRAASAPSFFSESTSMAVASDPPTSVHVEILEEVMSLGLDSSPPTTLHVEILDEVMSSPPWSTLAGASFAAAGSSADVPEGFASVDVISMILLRSATSLALSSEISSSLTFSSWGLTMIFSSRITSHSSNSGTTSTSSSTSVFSGLISIDSMVVVEKPSATA